MSHDPEHRRAYIREYMRLRRARERMGLPPAVGAGAVGLPDRRKQSVRDPDAAAAREAKARRAEAERMSRGSRMRRGKRTVIGLVTLCDKSRPRQPRRSAAAADRALLRQDLGEGKSRPLGLSRSRRQHLPSLDQDAAAARGTRCGIIVDPRLIAKGDFWQPGHHVGASLQRCGTCERARSAPWQKLRTKALVGDVIAAKEAARGRSWCRAVLRGGPLDGAKIRVQRARTRDEMLWTDSRQAAMYVGEAPTLADGSTLAYPCPPCKLQIIGPTGETLWHWRRRLDRGSGAATSGAYEYFHAGEGDAGRAQRPAEAKITSDAGAEREKLA